MAKIDVTNIYVNLLIMSISRKCSLAKLIKDAEVDTELYMALEESSLAPKGIEGLYFAESLARRMGSSLGEAYCLSDTRKEEILLDLVGKFTPISSAYDMKYDDSDKANIEFSGGIAVLDVTDEEKILRYYHGLISGSPADVDYIYTNYILNFYKTSYGDKRGVQYSIAIEGAKPFQSPYFYDAYEVWVGCEGPLADFIERAIADHNLSNLTEVNGIGARENKGHELMDELVEYVFNDTRTIDLLDKFEGYNDRDAVKYHHLIIKNAHRILIGNRYCNFNLVIERGRGTDYIGDITFTAYKKGETYGLSRHITSEMTDEIIEQYLDADQFFRFSKPYLLRAQNSHNRMGYGWEWDWSGGYGDYTEGTLYGETTNYFFVGVYVSSGHFYEPKQRKPFVTN